MTRSAFALDFLIWRHLFQ